MTLRWFLSSASRTPWWFLVLLLPSGLCSARKVAFCLASLSPLCLSPHSSGLSLTCSGFSCCVASTFLSHCPLASTGVAVLLTALAITVPVVRGQGFWGGAASHWSLRWHASVGRLAPECLPMCSCVTSTFLLAQWTNAIAEGLPVFHGAQLAIDATLVSPLRADGEPHRRCPEVDGAALTFARRRKEHTSPELARGQAAKPARESQ